MRWCGAHISHGGRSIILRHLSHLPNLFTNSTFGQIYREYTSLLTFPWSNQFHSHHSPSSTHQTTLSLETHPNWNSFLSVQTHPSKRCLPTNTPPTQHKKRKGSVVHTQQKTPLMIYDILSLTINVFIVFIQLFQIQQCTRGHPYTKNNVKKETNQYNPKLTTSVHSLTFTEQCTGTGQFSSFHVQLQTAQLCIFFNNGEFLQTQQQQSWYLWQTSNIKFQISKKKTRHTTNTFSTTTTNQNEEH